MIKGTPTEPFKIEKDLRQGDSFFNMVSLCLVCNLVYFTKTKFNKIDFGSYFETKNFTIRQNQIVNTQN